MKFARHIAVAALVAGGIFALAACDDTDGDGDEDIRDAGSAVSGTVSDAVGGDDSADDELEDRYNDLRDRFNDLSDDASAQVEDAWAALSDAFDRFQDASEDERSAVRDALESAADELEQRLDDLQGG